MTKGRTRIPAGVKGRTGNADKKSNRHPVDLPAGRLPDPLDVLTDRAAAIYTATAAMLNQSGYLRPADTYVLNLFAQAMAQFEMLAGKLGCVADIAGVEGAGRSGLNPLWVAYKDVVQIIRGLSRQLGLSPADRSKIQLGLDAVDDGFEDFAK